jgi:hypothetical protein
MFRRRKHPIVAASTPDHKRHLEMGLWFLFASRRLPCTAVFFESVQQRPILIPFKTKLMYPIWHARKLGYMFQDCTFRNLTIYISVSRYLVLQLSQILLGIPSGGQHRLLLYLDFFDVVHKKVLVILKYVMIW